MDLSNRLVELPLSLGFHAKKWTLYVGDIFRTAFLNFTGGDALMSSGVALTTTSHG